MLCGMACSCKVEPFQHVLVEICASLVQACALPARYVEILLSLWAANWHLKNGSGINPGVDA